MLNKIIGLLTLALLSIRVSAQSPKKIATEYDYMATERAAIKLFPDFKKQPLKQYSLKASFSGMVRNQKIDTSATIQMFEMSKDVLIAIEWVDSFEEKTHTIDGVTSKEEKSYYTKMSLILDRKESKFFILLDDKPVPQMSIGCNSIKLNESCDCFLGGYKLQTMLTYVGP